MGISHGIAYIGFLDHGGVIFIVAYANDLVTTKGICYAADVSALGNSAGKDFDTGNRCSYYLIALINKGADSCFCFVALLQSELGVVSVKIKV